MKRSKLHINDLEILGAAVQNSVARDLCTPELILNLDKLKEGEWSASRPGRCTSGERAPVALCTNGKQGSGVGLDAIKKTCLAPA